MPIVMKSIPTLQKINIRTIISYLNQKVKYPMENMKMGAIVPLHLEIPVTRFGKDAFVSHMSRVL